jgi:uncharacterized protein YdcH (DUF465 family)
MGIQKNENEWVYNLKEIHKRKLEQKDQHITKLEQKINHLSEIIKELEQKYLEENLQKTEIMNGFTKLREKYKDELYFNGKLDIDSEMLTNNFMQNVS